MVLFGRLRAGWAEIDRARHAVRSAPPVVVVRGSLRAPALQSACDPAVWMRYQSMPDSQVSGAPARCTRCCPCSVRRIVERRRADAPGAGRHAGMTGGAAMRPKRPTAPGGLQQDASPVGGAETAQARVPQTFGSVHHVGSLEGRKSSSPSRTGIYLGRKATKPSLRVNVNRCHPGYSSWRWLCSAPRWTSAGNATRLLLVTAVPRQVRRGQSRARTVVLGGHSACRRQLQPLTPCFCSFIPPT